MDASDLSIQFKAGNMAHDICGSAAVPGTALGLAYAGIFERKRPAAIPTLARCRVIFYLQQ